MNYLALTISNQYYAWRAPEDAWAVSDKYPVMAVADGVTLYYYHLKNLEDYPNPSPVKELAEMFVKDIIRYIEENWERVGQKYFWWGIFGQVNLKIRKFNKEHGVWYKKDRNYMDKNLMDIVGAVGLIKNNKLYWAKICDSRIIVWDKNGKAKLDVADGWEVAKKRGDFGYRKDKIENWRLIKKERRNAINPDGSLGGYGTLTGEDNALKYLEEGVFDLEKGDRVFVFTDGMNDYFGFNKFKSIINRWQAGDGKIIGGELKKWMMEVGQDKEALGSERTLVGIINI